jgi:hypothetical protein
VPLLLLLIHRRRLGLLRPGCCQLNVLLCLRCSRVQHPKRSGRLLVLVLLLLLLLLRVVVLRGRMLLLLLLGSCLRACW